METVTSKEAADRIGISLSTFHNWIAAERITPVKKLPGARGPYLFDAADVERIREEHLTQLREALEAAERAS